MTARWCSRSTSSAPSKGRLAVEVYTSGQFCSNERECMEATAGGRPAGLHDYHGRLWRGLWPAQALDLPYLFGGDAVAECVLDGPIADKLSQAMLDEDIAIRLMTVSNTGGWRNFATTESPIRTPEDVRGRKIRTITAPLQQEFVRQLGGNPTPIPWSEVYTALSTGVVSGTKNGIHDIVSMQLHEQIRFVTLDNHAYMGGLWWYSELSWQQLPYELQEIVLEGFQRVEDGHPQRDQGLGSGVVRRLRRLGRHVAYPPPLRKAGVSRSGSRHAGLVHRNLRRHLADADLDKRSRCVRGAGHRGRAMNSETLPETATRC